MYRWLGNITETQKKRSLIYWQTYVEAHHSVRDALLRRIVTNVVGWDTNVPVMSLGFSLHDEMLALSRAGLSVSEILASTMRKTGERMGMNTGVISSGFKADLALLRETRCKTLVQQVQSNQSLLTVVYFCERTSTSCFVLL